MKPVHQIVENWLTNPPTHSCQVGDTFLAFDYCIDQGRIEILRMSCTSGHVQWEFSQGAFSLRHIKVYLAEWLEFHLPATAVRVMMVEFLGSLTRD